MRCLLGTNEMESVIASMVKFVMESLAKGVTMPLDSKKKLHVIEMFPVSQESMSTKEFLDRLPDIEEQIASATPVAPILGKPGFGSIQVTYRRPIYKSLPSALSGKSV